jgi:geranylgeranyl pyrophosphate synthase
VNTRPRMDAAPVTALSALVDRALSPAELRAAVHAEDWPDPSAAAPLPRELWGLALGDVARDILSRPSRKFRAHLCELGWRLGDGAGELPPVVPALVEIIHAGSLVVDDIEDGSRERRGGPALHLEHGLPRALNGANWMYFWALRLIDQIDAGPLAGRERIFREVVRAMHDSHLGQALDLTISVARLPQSAMYRTVATSTMLKTGSLTELAARLGAMVAGASEARVEVLARFGRRIGLGLQMLDDFGNLTGGSEGNASKALEDLRNGRATWPWALAARTMPPATFSELAGRVRMLARNDVDDHEDGRARAQAAELRMAVGLSGRRQAESYLQVALDQLAQAVGPRPELALVASEIQRLEATYG